MGPSGKNQSLMLGGITPIASWLPICWLSWLLGTDEDCTTFFLNKLQVNKMADQKNEVEAGKERTGRSVERLQPRRLINSKLLHTG